MENYKNETFEEKIQRISLELKRDRRTNWLRSSLISMLISCLSVSVVLLISLMILDVQSENYVDKGAIQESLSKVIHNGGSIDEVRQVYSSKHIEEKPIFTSQSEFLKSHYTADVPLLSILSDLLVNYYRQDSIVPDSVYVSRLRNMITEYNTIHPFDGLEESQRYYLENIHQKLDSNYILIHEDVVKLSDELDRKNQLVNKYLSKSEISFWISIGAVIITIVLSTWQIKQNGNTTKLINKFFGLDDGKNSKSQKG